MMKTDILPRQADTRFPNGRKWLNDQLERSDSLNQFALLAVHLAGCSLVLGGPLLMLFAGTGSIYLYSTVSGPLDWFFVEVLTGLTLFGAFLSWQLVMLRPATSDGIALDESQSPELYGMLNRRAGHFKARAIRHIAMTTQPRLKVVVTPTLPVPLWHRYTLSTGIPLLFFLSHSQFRLALASAVAASVAEPSRMKRWLTQACQDWPLILQALEEQPCLLSKMVLKPLRQVAQASERLGRRFQTDWREQQGYWLRENSDEQNLVDYFANQEVADAFLNRQYWPMILKAAERCPTPVVKAFSHLPLLLDKTLNQELAERWLMQAQTASSNGDNSLRDLLAALQIDHLHWSGLPEKSAFSTLFSSPAVLKQLDAHWQNEIEPEWRQRHTQFKADRSRFENLRKRAESQVLHGESALRYVKLAERFMDKDDATAAFQQTAATNRNDAKVCFACGLALLRAGAGSAGTSALQRAASLEPALAKRAKSLIHEHKNAWLREQAPNAARQTAHKVSA